MPVIGELRERVAILQRGSVTGDGQGGRTTAPSTLATVWANVRPLSAREQLQTGAVTATVDYEVELRYRADVSPTMRLQWTPYGAGSAKTLQIVGAPRAKDGARARMLLDCREVPA